MGRTVLVRWVECGALRAREMLIRRAPVAGCYRQWVRPGSFQVGCGVVPAVDQDLLVVLLRDDLNPQQVRRDDLLAVVVRLGVVHLDLLALQLRVGHRHGHLCELAGVLEDGRVLLAGDDRLHRADLRVLTGDDRVRLAAGAVAGALERAEDAVGKLVVRREHAVDLVTAGVGAREQVLHAGLGRGRVPAQRGDGFELRLLALDDERALVDQRLHDRHRALEEEGRVVVVRRAGEQLDVERARLVGGLPARVEQAHARQQRGPLRHAVLDPALGRLRRHRHADGLLAAVPAAAAAGATRATAATGGQRQGQREGQGQTRYECSELLGAHSSSFEMPSWSVPVESRPGVPRPPVLSQSGSSWVARSYSTWITSAPARRSRRGVPPVTITVTVTSRTTLMPDVTSEAARSPIRCFSTAEAASDSS